MQLFSLFQYLFTVAETHDGSQQPTDFNILLPLDVYKRQAIIRQFLQAPLTDTGTVEHIINVVLTPLTVGITSIIFQNHANVQDVYKRQRQ